MDSFSSWGGLVEMYDTCVDMLETDTLHVATTKPIRGSDHFKTRTEKPKTEWRHENYIDPMIFRSEHYSLERFESEGKPTRQTNDEKAHLETHSASPWVGFEVWEEFLDCMNHNEVVIVDEEEYKNREVQADSADMEWEQNPSFQPDWDDGEITEDEEMGLNTNGKGDKDACDLGKEAVVEEREDRVNNGAKSVANTDMYVCL